MPLPPRTVVRLATLATVLSAVVGLLGALAMRDRVRLVDILALFFGGVGSGAGIAVLVGRRRAARDAGLHALRGALHTPPTVPWRRDE